MKNTPLHHTVKNLSPAYFAMVMATGIVSNASDLLGMKGFAFLLFKINIVLFLVLLAATIFRLFQFRKYFFNDLFDHIHGMGFFTAVAATAILGMQFILMYGNFRIAEVLWVMSILLWVIITYTIFTNLTIKSNKPDFVQGINGGWLLAVVSTQSIAILSSALAMHSPAHKLILNFFAFSMWLWGGMLYIWMISLIFYRYTFFKFYPDDLTPPYWINMGAMAISTLAGATLIQNTAHAPFLMSTLPFLKGFTIFYWATGTWWIPMLIILAIWRHVYRRFPLTYDSQYWGAVFPLGMYTACTFKMAEALEMEFLKPVPRYFIYIAITAWCLAFIGFLREVLNLFKPDNITPPAIHP